MFNSIELQRGGLEMSRMRPSQRHPNTNNQYDWWIIQYDAIRTQVIRFILFENTQSFVLFFLNA
jgi:hypothetical protein